MRRAVDELGRRRERRRLAEEVVDLAASEAGERTLKPTRAISPSRAPCGASRAHAVATMRSRLRRISGATKPRSISRPRRPAEVVDHEHERRRRLVQEEGGDRVEESKRLSWSADRRDDVGEAMAERRHEPRDLGGVDFEGGA
jgi:hypothetical protein